MNEKLVREVTLIATSTLAIIIVSVVIAMLLGLFNEKVDNQKIFEIIHLLQPNTVQFDIKADKGQFREVYDIDDVADFKRDILEFKIHGQRQQSTMRDWRRL